MFDHPSIGAVVIEVRYPVSFIFFDYESNEGSMRGSIMSEKHEMIAPCVAVMMMNDLVWKNASKSRIATRRAEQDCSRGSIA